MDRPGSLDMKHITYLIKSRPLLSLVPDQSIISSANPDDGSHYQAARGDGYLYIYNPYGKAFEINMNKISGKRLRCYWFSPRDGSISSLGTYKSGTYSKKFDPPGSEARGNDCILIVDDASKKYPDTRIL